MLIKEVSHRKKGAGGTFLGEIEQRELRQLRQNAGRFFIKPLREEKRIWLNMNSG